MLGPRVGEQARYVRFGVERDVGFDTIFTRSTKMLAQLVLPFGPQLCTLFLVSELYFGRVGSICRGIHPSSSPLSHLNRLLDPALQDHLLVSF